MSITEKPPLGLMPRRRWDELHPCFQLDLMELRFQMIKDAIFRYLSASLDIPDEWFKECYELGDRLVEERRWARDPLNLFEPYFKEVEFRNRNT